MEILTSDRFYKQFCGECDNHVDAVIVVGAEPDWESATAFLCIDCITKAAKLMKENDDEQSTFKVLYG